MTPLRSNGTKRISYEPNTHFHAPLFTSAVWHTHIHTHPRALQTRREELLPVFPPKWKEPSTIITIFFTKRWALCTGTGNNDHVLFCGDSFILPLLWMQSHRGACSEMSAEEASRCSETKMGFSRGTLVERVSVHCLLNKKETVLRCQLTQMWQIVYPLSFTPAPCW